MRKQLREAIEALVYSENASGLRDKIEHLREAYESHLEGATDTQLRVEFLEEKLEEGYSKREAARLLVEHDPKVGHRTAETIVYTVFSGMYQTTKRGRRKRMESKGPAVIRIPEPPPDVTDDEGLL